jgi:hypothetical protein
MRVLLFIFMVLILPLGTEAQGLTDIGGGALTITLNPQHPQPGEKVTATIDDYSLSTAGAAINWRLDGKAVEVGQGTRAIEFTAPALGTKTALAVSLSLPGGARINAERTITPRYLDIILEPQTYTPRFYAGRALPSHNSIVRATALLHEKDGAVDPTKYSYTWRLNNKVIGGGARLGGFKTDAIVPHGLSSTLTVDIADQTGQTVSRRSFSIPSVPVELQLYEVSALYGLEDKVVKDSLQMIGNSLTLRAVPYYLDLRAGSTQDIFTEWSINNRATETSSRDPFEITLNRSGGGSTQIGFKVRNLDILIQGDEISVPIQF